MLPEDVTKFLDKFLLLILVHGFNQLGPLLIDTTREALLVQLVEILFDKVEEHLEDILATPVKDEYFLKALTNPLPPSKIASTTLSSHFIVPMSPFILAMS
jgi:hypothetical protein